MTDSLLIAALGIIGTLGGALAGPSISRRAQRDAAERAAHLAAVERLHAERVTAYVQMERWATAFFNEGISDVIRARELFRKYATEIMPSLVLLGGPDVRQAARGVFAQYEDAVVSLGSPDLTPQVGKFYDDARIYVETLSDAMHDEITRLADPVPLGSQSLWRRRRARK